MPAFISKPDIPLQKLATITHWKRSGLTVFWDATSRRVFFHLMGIEDPDSNWPGTNVENTNTRFYRPNGEMVLNGTDEWWVQEDGNICDSLMYFVPDRADQLLFRYLFLFRGSHGKVADDALHADIYDCDWSDFACENLSLEFDILTRMGFFFENKYMRAGRALAEHHCPYDRAVRNEDARLWATKVRAKEVYEGFA